MRGAVAGAAGGGSIEGWAAQALPDTMPLHTRCLQPNSVCVACPPHPTPPHAVFDKTKLSWMNGQHLRGLPADELAALVGGRWVASGLLARTDSPFVAAALTIVQNSLELVAGAGGGVLGWLLAGLHEWAVVAAAPA